MIAMEKIVPNNEFTDYFLGIIEPHASLLIQPNQDQLLYKIMQVEHFVKSFTYLQDFRLEESFKIIQVEHLVKKVLKIRIFTLIE